MRGKVFNVILVAIWAYLLYRTVTGGAIVFGVKLSNLQLVYSNLTMACLYELATSTVSLLIGCVTGLVISAIDKDILKNTKQGIKSIVNKYKVLRSWLNR